MKENYAISRIASYKFKDCGGVLKEALRILPNYDNPDCDPALSYLNVALVETDLKGLTPEKYILKYREDNNIKGRFNTSATNPKSLTNVMCQSLFTASSEWLSVLDRNEQIKFFEDCLDFFKSEFPSVHIVAANIHFDETTPHMHVTWLPIVERVNKKTGELENVFSTTLLMPGKDFFPKYQDRFYAYISSKYDGFTRSYSDRKNMSVGTYKEFCKMQEQLREYECALRKSKKEISDLYLQLALLNKEVNRFEGIPLLGFLVSILQEMEQDRQARIIKEFIKAAELEQKQMELEQKTNGAVRCVPLSEQIMSADNMKPILSKLHKISKKIQKER